jgi:cell division protein FtsB
MTFKHKINSKIKVILGDYVTYGLFVVLILVSVSVYRNYKDYKAALSREVELRTKAEELEKEGEDLSRKLAEMQTEFYIEKQIRDGLHLAKEGEIVLVLPDDDTLRKSIEKEEKREEERVSNWRKWLETFKF